MPNKKKCCYGNCPEINPQPISNFSRNKSEKDGYCDTCKTCNKKWRDKPEVKKIRNERQKKASRTTERYNQAKRAAKERNKEFLISKIDYYDLIKEKCFYCYGNLPECGIGLDRINNEKGYLLENVVPCCTACNTIKSFYLSFNEMIEIRKVLIESRKRREVTNKAKEK